MNLNTALRRLREAGFSRRPSQEVMMESVDEAVRDRKISVLEGGTGIGKSYGYLIPALCRILAERQALAQKQPRGPRSKGKGDSTEGRTIVVSTATKALQDQLTSKDLPDLQKTLGLPFNFVAAKGRRNYACTKKLLSARDNPQADLVDGATQQIATRMVRALETQTWDGDLDRWAAPVPAKLAGDITVDRHGCLGRKCECVQRCPFYQARNEMKEAELVVVNHALLLSDLALGGGKLLPSPERSVYIIDEAHHLPKQSIQAFAAQSSVFGAIDWLGDLDNLVAKQSVNRHLMKYMSGIRKKADQVRGLLKDVGEILQTNFTDLAKDGVWRFKCLPKPLDQMGEQIRIHATDLTDVLTTLLDAAKDVLRSQGAAQSSGLHRWMSSVGFLLQKTESLKDVWHLLLTEDPVHAPPIARWITMSEPVVGSSSMRLGAKDASPSLEFHIQAAPTSSSDLLRSGLWNRLEHGAVLCSATLRSLGSFDKYLSDAGLKDLTNPRLQGVHTHELPSPFDYSKSRLVVPAMQYEPSYQTASEHTAEVSTLLPRLIEEERVAGTATGTLVLFASSAQMRQVYENMSEELQRIILMQYRTKNHEIMEQHRKRIDMGISSIIFGVQSFSEGVDLPGNYCRHVIISKLPFAIPSDPVEKTRAEWIEARGGNAFVAYALPEASVKLTQSVGRLVRRETDCGRVTLLDKRLLTKRYGPQIIKNLPPFVQILGTATEVPAPEQPETQPNPTPASDVPASAGAGTIQSTMDALAAR